jgi:hypothetical protein
MKALLTPQCKNNCNNIDAFCSNSNGKYQTYLVSHAFGTALMLNEQTHTLSVSVLSSTNQRRASLLHLALIGIGETILRDTYNYEGIAFNY